MSTYLGQIILFAGPYEVEGWMYCDGRQLDVQQNQALFSILGNTFGGTSPKTFCLPDLRNETPAHAMKPTIKSTESLHYMICVSGGDYPPRAE